MQPPYCPGISGVLDCQSFAADLQESLEHIGGVVMCKSFLP